MPLPKPGSNSLSGNSFFIFITRFLPSLATLLVVIWYSRYLTQGVYGNYQRFWILLNVIYPFACFGIHVVIMTYSRDFILRLARTIKASYFLLYFLWMLALSAVFAALEYYTLHIPFIIPFFF